jgi:Na+-translocating ferredoxin:NAD+ oxidoreductase RnfA subunit
MTAVEVFLPVINKRHAIITQNVLWNTHRFSSALLSQTYSPNGSAAVGLQLIVVMMLAIELKIACSTN